MNAAEHLRPLQKVADSIAVAAGWSPRKPDLDNVVVFRLENGLRLELLCPDGKTIILRGLIRVLPDSPNANDEIDTLIEQILVLNAALCRKSRAIPALHERRLELHRIILAGETAPDEPDMPEEARTFLNDLSWWRKQITHEESPHTFPSSAFFSGDAR